MTGLNELTIAEARDKLRGGEVTAVELTEACLAAVEGAGHAARLRRLAGPASRMEGRHGCEWA